MKKITAIASVLLAVVGGTALAAPSHAAKPYAFSIANYKQINTDNGKPSQWSTRVSSPEVKTALKSTWAKNRLNKMEDKIKRESVRFNAPYSLSRDLMICDIRYVDGGKAEDKCVSSVDGRYDYYLDWADAHEEKVVYVKSGFAVKSSMKN